MSAIKFDYPTYKLFEVSQIRTRRLICDEYHLDEYREFVSCPYDLGSDNGTE